MALPGRCSLIRVCWGINSPPKTKQANGEKARHISVYTPPLPPLHWLTETSRQFTVQEEAFGWLAILISFGSV